MSNTNELAKIATNKSLLKEYNVNNKRVVYLKNNDEFQIQLFNDQTNDISARISINGEYLSNDIVIKPGQRIWLERYLNTPKKFKFETYEVEDGNSAVDNAIRNNGVINISFYRKKTYDNNLITLINDSYINHSYINNNYIAKGIGGNELFGSSICNKLYSNDNIKYTSAASSSINNNLRNIDATVLNCDIADYGTFNANNTLDLKVETNAVKETGRIAEGSYSNQKFETIFESFETWSFRTETIQILPESQKPYTVDDLEKLYCTECGRKLKTKYKFCPYCGNKID